MSIVVDNLPQDSDYSRYQPRVTLWASLESLATAPVWQGGVHIVATPSGTHVDLLIGGNLARVPRNGCLPVFLSGAISNRARKKGPFFSGVALSREAETPFLAISDPTLNTDPDLTLGWYTGTAGAGMQDFLVRLLDVVSERFERELLLVGGSGGGFAALHMVERLKGDTSALVWNPQTDVLQYSPPAVRQYITSVLGMTSEDVSGMSSSERAAALGRAGIVNHVEGERQVATGRTRILYLQNSTDDHVAEHAVPYLSRSALRTVKSGRWADGEGRVLVIADMSKGHLPPPRPAILAALKAMLRRETSAASASLKLDAAGLLPPAAAADLPAPMGGPQQVSIFILGSCVSRDTFEFLEPAHFQIEAYVARQSLISSFSPPTEPVIAPERLASAFQRRMLEWDAESALPGLLQQHSETTDLLLWDLFDERLGVHVSNDNTVVTTDSVEIRNEREQWQAPPRGYRHLAFGSEQHFKLFREALRLWRQTLSDSGLLSRTLLLAPSWAGETTDGNTTPRSFGMSAEEANASTARYLEAVRRELGVPILGRDIHAPLASIGHQWGVAPFHYDDNTYASLAREIAGAAIRVCQPRDWPNSIDELVRVPSAKQRDPRHKDEEKPSARIAEVTPRHLRAELSGASTGVHAFHLFDGRTRVASTSWTRSDAHTFTISRAGAYRCRIYILNEDRTRTAVTSATVRVD